MSRRTCRTLALSIGLLAAIGAAGATSVAERPPGHAAIASAHTLATAAGHEILDAGGNAFDAAVAVSAALSVVEPASSGIGGGAFFLVHRAADGFETLVDARETSPAAAKRADFLDAQGRLNRDKSVNGPLAAGIPGLPAGLVHVAATYGKLPLARSLAPAIRLARDGFEPDARNRTLLGMRREAVLRDKAAAKIFLAGDGALPPPGWRLRQRDLANTLEALAKQGHDGFYRGRVAERLVSGVVKAGGVWSAADLAAYRIKERAPIRFDYRGYRIVTAPPPSSGGVALAEILHILTEFDLAKLDRTTRLHLLAEAMRRAYRDRTLYLGDTDFVDVPLERLLSPYYAQGLAASIRLDRATPSASLPGFAGGPRGTDTSHFSAIDRDGNLVSVTQSINLPYGACFVPAGTGVLLNNEMDDFAIQPGEPNAYGLLGADANAIAPGKRMLSSMTPSFVIGADRLAVIGTPGGSRIITMVLLGILDFIDGRPAQDIVAAKRVHHQYMPDAISAEAGALTATEVESLRKLGHTISDGESTWGNMQVVVWDKRSNQLSGGSDPRGTSGAAVVK